MDDLIFLAMPPVVAFFASTAFTIGSTAVTWGTVISFASTVLSFGLSLMAKKRGATNQFERGSTTTVRDSEAPRVIAYGKTRVGTVMAHFENTGSNNDVHLILMLCDGPIESIDEIYFNDQLAIDADGVAQGDFSGLVTVSKNLGALGQAADATALAAISDWSSGDKLDGIAYIYLKLVWNATAFPQGLPNISANVRGRNDIYDPRTDSTGYTANAALIINHWLTLQRVGLGVNYATEINATQLETAADVCDESVDLRSGGTESVATGNSAEARYEINGVIYSDESPSDVLGNLAEAMAGSIVWTNGLFEIIPGEYDIPTFELIQNMIVGEISMQSRLPKTDRLNTIRTRFISEQSDWQPTSSATLTAAQYVYEDGEEIATEMDLPFTKSTAAVQRIAKIQLESSRREKVLTLSCNLKALRSSAGKNVFVTLPKYGFDQKPFAVIEWALSVDAGSPIIKLKLKETDASVYDWVPSSDEQLHGTVRDLTSSLRTPPFFVTGQSVSHTYSRLDGNDTTLTWTRPRIPNEDYICPHVRFCWREDGGTWSDAEDIPPYIQIKKLEALDSDAVYEAEFKVYHQTATRTSTGLTLGTTTASGINRLFFATPLQGAEVATPAFDIGRLVNPGAFPVDVTLTCATAGASIRYGTSAPPAEDTDGTLYTAPISVTAGQKIYARAFKSGMTKSSIAVSDFVSSGVAFSTAYSSAFGTIQNT